MRTIRSGVLVCLMIGCQRVCGAPATGTELFLRGYSVIPTPQKVELQEGDIDFTTRGPLMQAESRKTTSRFAHCSAIFADFIASNCDRLQVKRKMSSAFRSKRERQGQLQELLRILRSKNRVTD